MWCSAWSIIISRRSSRASRSSKGLLLDTELSAEDWQGLISRLQGEGRSGARRAVSARSQEQLWGAIGAVFGSWMNQRAITYRRLNDIPESWGTAVNVQAMVFGNMGETSATGVAFTRNPSTGESELYGEFLINAQGEDVVAGIRTPQNITEAARIEAGSDKPSMEKALPEVFADFVPHHASCSKNIIATCRTWSSPSSAANSGCCRPAMASARRRQLCASRSRWRRKV